MHAVEWARSFMQKKELGVFRKPAVVVIEFGGGNCNKAGSPSCRDFCAVPDGRIYNPELDPSLEQLSRQFFAAAALKPAIVSLVPNGEAVINHQKSNSSWGEVRQLKESGNITEKQAGALYSYFHKVYGKSFSADQPMTPAEKTAVTIALGKTAGLNLSLTTNGSFLDKELLRLYGEEGLNFINLSYHPNKPYDPAKYEPLLEHLIGRANQAIEAGIIPTIVHVLTRENADTFVALADYVSEHDIFFGVGIASARGGSFSADNRQIEPTKTQVKTVFRRLLARRLFADRHIRTTIPYLLLAPYFPDWVCENSTDFFHLSFENIEGKLLPKINVCSEVRPQGKTTPEDFLDENGLHTPSYLEWRSEAKNNCQGCRHQCFFESETRNTLGIGMGIDEWDWYTTAGKGARLRYALRHPLRPTVSRRLDFQKAYLWESLLQGMARIVAGLKDNAYWQETFKRSGQNFEEVLKECIDDASDPQTIMELTQKEQVDHQLKIWSLEKKRAQRRKPTFVISAEWHDAGSLQSRFLRKAYLPFQQSGREAEIAIPTLHFAGLLRHESPGDFQKSIEKIIEGKRKQTILESLMETAECFYRVIKNLFLPFSACLGVS